MGGRFSAALGIDLRSGRSEEIFKWFLASTLFGARISEALAVRTYKAFENEGLTSPKRIVQRGWDGLVAVLDRGGYTRYDFKTATKLLEVSKALIERYGGDLNMLHAGAADTRDLEEKLKSLGRGIGEVTANIFLRELRGIWKTAEPLPSEIVLSAARHLRLPGAKAGDSRRVLISLKDKWLSEGNRATEFADLEAALVRYGLALRRRSIAGTTRGSRKSEI